MSIDEFTSQTDVFPSNVQVEVQASRILRFVDRIFYRYEDPVDIIWGMAEGTLVCGGLALAGYGIVEEPKAIPLGVAFAVYPRLVKWFTPNNQESSHKENS